MFPPPSTPPSEARAFGPPASADEAATTAAAFWRGPIDLLPVSLFRLAIAMLLLVDTLQIFPNLLLYYSDEGIWPRRLVDTAQQAFSFFWFVGSAHSIYGLYGATILSLCLLAFGLHTRIASVVSFVLLTSLHARFPFSLDSSDSVARLCLFFLMFCASGNRASLDAVRAARKGTPLATHGHALPVRLLQAQIGAVYYATASWKLIGPTWRSGSALHYALSIPHMFSRPWALAIANSSWLVHLGTWGTLAIELAILLAIFSPWRRSAAKAWAIAMGLLLHVTIALTMSVGLFTSLMPVTYLALLEPAWAHRLVQYARRIPSAALPPKAVVRTSAFGRLRGWMLVAIFVVIQVASSPARAMMPAPILSLVDRASLWGSWQMFAPNPPAMDARLRGEAIFPDGARHNLFDGLEGDFGAAHQTFSRRWKVEESLAGGRRSLLRGFAEWRCRQTSHMSPHIQPGEDSFRFELILDTWSIPPLGERSPRSATPHSKVVLRGECRSKELLTFALQ